MYGRCQQQFSKKLFLITKTCVSNCCANYGLSAGHSRHTCSAYYARERFRQCISVCLAEQLNLKVERLNRIFRSVRIVSNSNCGQCVCVCRILHEFHACRLYNQLQ